MFFGGADEQIGRQMINDILILSGKQLCQGIPNPSKHHRIIYLTVRVSVSGWTDGHTDGAITVCPPSGHKKTIFLLSNR